MNLSNKIREHLDKKIIIGKDNHRYLFKLTQGNEISVEVADSQNLFRKGVLPCLICNDHKKEIFSRERADFTAVYGQGLYKKVIRMISEAVPPGTTYRTQMANLEDHYSIISAMNDGKNLESCLKSTLIGHVFYSSQFNKISLFYKNIDEKIFEGEKALEEFALDHARNIFTTSHGTELYLTAKKE